MGHWYVCLEVASSNGDRPGTARNVVFKGRPSKKGSNNHINSVHAQYTEVARLGSPGALPLTSLPPKFRITRGFAGRIIFFFLREVFFFLLIMYGNPELHDG